MKTIYKIFSLSVGLGSILWGLFTFIMERFFKGIIYYEHDLVILNTEIILYSFGLFFYLLLMKEVLK